MDVVAKVSDTTRLERVKGKNKFNKESKRKISVFFFWQDKILQERWLMDFTPFI